MRGGIIELTLYDEGKIAINARTIASVIEARSGSHGVQIRYTCGGTTRVAEVKEDYDTVVRCWRHALSKRPEPTGLE